MADDTREPESWHFDKRVPVAIIITLITQLIGVAVLASKLDSRVEALEKSDTRHERSIDALTTERDGNRERLTRLEESSKTTLDLVRQVDSKIDRMWHPDIRSRPP